MRAIKRWRDKRARRIHEKYLPHSVKNLKLSYKEIWAELKELNAVKWSVKQQGYAIGAAVFQAIEQTDIPQAPTSQKLINKCSTQADVESPWFRYWVNEIQCAPLPHRKLWEFAYILQNLHAYGALSPGKSGLGFGCGEEPLPSYFASHDIAVTVTDLDPDQVAGMGWAETGQHTSSIEQSFRDNLVDRARFDDLVSLKYVDMNDIPAELDESYDFCWSVCALEHLGSITQGLDFIKNSLKCLKPGGVAVHTTEFNYTETDNTVDFSPTVLFLRKHFEILATELRAAGFLVEAFDFNVGQNPLDCFVDLPPYEHDNPMENILWEDGVTYRPAHLKLSVSGFPATCIAITVRRPG